MSGHLSFNNLVGFAYESGTGIAYALNTTIRRDPSVAIAHPERVTNMYNFNSKVYAWSDVKTLLYNSSSAGQQLAKSPNPATRRGSLDDATPPNLFSLIFFTASVTLLVVLIALVLITYCACVRPRMKKEEDRYRALALANKANLAAEECSPQRRPSQRAGDGDMRDNRNDSIKSIGTEADGRAAAAEAASRPTLRASSSHSIASNSPSSRLRDEHHSDETRSRMGSFIAPAAPKARSSPQGGNVPNPWEQQQPCASTWIPPRQTWSPSPSPPAFISCQPQPSPPMLSAPRGSPSGYSNPIAPAGISGAAAFQNGFAGGRLAPFPSLPPAQRTLSSVGSSATASGGGRRSVTPSPSPPRQQQQQHPHPQPPSSQVSCAEDGENPVPIQPLRRRTSRVSFKE